MPLYFLFQPFWTSQLVLGRLLWIVQHQMGATCHKIIVSLKSKLLHDFHNSAEVNFQKSFKTIYMAIEFWVTGDIQLPRIWRLVCQPFLHNSIISDCFGVFLGFFVFLPLLHGRNKLGSQKLIQNHMCISPRLGSLAILNHSYLIQAQFAFLVISRVKCRRIWLDSCYFYRKGTG